MAVLPWWRHQALDNTPAGFSSGTCIANIILTAQRRHSGYEVVTPQKFKSRFIQRQAFGDIHHLRVQLHITVVSLPDSTASCCSASLPSVTALSRCRQIDGLCKGTAVSWNFRISPIISDGCQWPAVLRLVGGDHRMWAKHQTGFLNWWQQKRRLVDQGTIFATLSQREPWMRCHTMKVWIWKSRCRPWTWQCWPWWCVDRVSRMVWWQSVSAGARWAEAGMVCRHFRTAGSLLTDARLVCTCSIER